MCVRRTKVDILEEGLICPFRIAYGQHNHLRNVIFGVELTDGTKGYGEAAIATHITGETIEETEKNLKDVGEELVGKEIFDYPRLSGYLRERLGQNRAAQAAIEMAVMDALTREMGIPLWRFFGSKPAKTVTDITLVIAESAETEEAVKGFYRSGFRKFKIKLAGEPEKDFGRILIVKKFMPKGEICLDANQSYSADGALKLLRQLEKVDIYLTMIEQPVDKRDWEGLKKVTRLSKVPVCADESIGSIADVTRLILEKGADVINIKLMKFGIFEGWQIACAAKAAGVRLMIGSMVESDLAATAAAHFAGGLGGFEFVDLDTPFFIKGQAGRNPYLNSRGVYNLKDVRAGIGIVPRFKKASK